MPDLKIQGVVEMSTEGAESALDRIADKSEKMAAKTEQSAGKAGAALGGIGENAGRSAGQMTRAEGKMLASIKRVQTQMELAGKTASQKLEYKISSQGLDPSKFEPALAGLREMENAQKRVGVSSAQMSASLRGVPAQFTDIITSLQGGQAPLTVFMQQGGQLKDMFGGAGNAARALGGYVIGLINPLTLTAAAVGVLGAAYYNGAKEEEEFRKTLILTGNVAGTTSDQLMNMAQSIASAAGVSQGSVAEALNEIASSGKISADMMGRVATAAVEMERVGGQAASATVAEFAALGEKPVDAILKLNDKYHFLTASVYEQINALQEQGRESDAAKVAQTAYADAIEARIPSLAANLGVLETAWNGVVNVAKLAWDSMSGVGRAKTLEQQLADAIGAKNGKTTERGNGNMGEKFTPGAANGQAQIDAISNEIEARDSLLLIQQASAKAEAAKVAWAKESEKYLDKEAQKRAEILRTTNMMTAAGKSQADIAKVVAQVEEKYKDKKTAGSQSNHEEKSTLAANLSAIKKDGEERIAAYTGAERILEARRSAGLIDERKYYDAKRGFLALETDAQEQTLQAEIVRLQAEKANGKERIDIQRQIAEKFSEITKLREKSAANAEILSINEIASNERLAKSYIDASEAADAYIQTVSNRNDREIAGVGKGVKYRSEEAARNQIEDKFVVQRQTLNRDLRNNNITQKQFDDYLSVAQKTYSEEIALYEARTAAIDAAQAHWENGALEAFANYRDAAADVSSQTRDLFGDALSGIEDAFVEFAKTGKLSFSNLADAILADLVRIQVRAAVSSVTSGLDLSSLFSSAASGTGSGSARVGSLFGAQIDGARASGGPVSAGGTYLVGEQGPEIITMGSHGYVTPNSAMGGINVSVHNYGADKVRVEQATDSRGQPSLRVFVAEAVADDMRRSGSRTSSVLRQRYGVQPALIGR